MEQLSKLIDLIYSLIPREPVRKEHFANVRLIAHRGAHEFLTENTLAAFTKCLDLGVWGIELDVRWTRDHVPVILHDLNGGRVFGRPDVLPQKMTLSELKKALPEIPTLSEVVQACGQQLHLMIEIKEQIRAGSESWRQLQQALAPLSAIDDYHVLSLNPQFFEPLQFLPPKARVGVTTTRLQPMLTWVLKNDCAGLAGHYLLLHNGLQRRLTAEARLMGTGFVNSKNLLYREMHRRVPWIFTDRAQSLSQWLP